MLEYEVVYSVEHFYEVAYSLEETYDVDIGLVYEISASDVDIYNGSYIVDPEFEAQTLATKNKKMIDDVVVNAIEVQRVSNAAGGRTVYIGGLIDG